jgi:hypothetical protein
LGECIKLKGDNVREIRGNGTSQSSGGGGISFLALLGFSGQALNRALAKGPICEVRLVEKAARCDTILQTLPDLN